MAAPTSQGYSAYRRRPQDPLGQTSPAGISQVVGQYTAPPMSDAQIQTSAQGQIDPIIAAITKTISDHANQASGAIGANSAALAKDLAGVDYTAPYRQAEGAQAATDASLRDALAGAGSGAANDLEARLAQINDPTVATAAAGVADRGAAIGNTELAHGSASLSNLIANAAAAGSYGAKQPGIARLTGLEQIGGVNKQAVSDIADKSAQIEAQLPSIVANLRSERGNDRQMAIQLLETLTGQNITKATARAGLGNAASALNFKYANADANLNAKANAKAAADAKPDPSLSKVYGYVVDANGKPILRNGQQVPVGGAKKSPFTPAEIQKFRGSAFTIADDSRNGYTVTTAQGETKQPAVQYGEALNRLRRAGIPDQIAISMLNRFYTTPGEMGRPYEQIPLTPVANQNAHRYKGRH